MKPKKLQYISDLHLEMRKEKDIPTVEPVEPGNSYLALCGDIGNPFVSTYETFLSIHSPLFVHILILSGNHEYYTSKKQQHSMTEMEDEIKTICGKFPNITYLNMDKLIIGKTKFIGCTFWSDISEIIDIAESIMNDYKNIYMESPGAKKRQITEKTGYGYSKTTLNENRRKLKGSDILELHIKMKEWLKHEIEKYVENDTYDTIIVLTHHPGSFKMLEKSDLYSSCYGTNCDHLFINPVKYWISGHTHSTMKQKIGESEGLSNCMGYPRQKVESFALQTWIDFY